MKRAHLATRRNGQIANGGILRAFAAILLAFTVIFAVSVDEASAQSYRFGRIDVEGNTRIETGTILSYAGINPGDSVSAGQLNTAYQNILGSGLFESVAVEPRGGTLVISVQEYPTINRISIEGNQRLKDEILVPLIQSQPRRVYSPNVAAADELVIRLPVHRP